MSEARADQSGPGDSGAPDGRGDRGTKSPKIDFDWRIVAVLLGLLLLNYILVTALSETTGKSRVEIPHTPTFLEQVRAGNAAMPTETTTPLWLGLLVNVPAVLIFGFWYRYLRRSGAGGMFSFGLSKAKKEAPSIVFVDDIDEIGRSRVPRRDDGCRVRHPPRDSADPEHGWTRRATRGRCLAGACRTLSTEQTARCRRQAVRSPKRPMSGHATRDAVASELGWDPGVDPPLASAEQGMPRTPR